MRRITLLDKIKTRERRAYALPRSGCCRSWPEVGPDKNSVCEHAPFTLAAEQRRVRCKRPGSRTRQVLSGVRRTERRPDSDDPQREGSREDPGIADPR